MGRMLREKGEILRLGDMDYCLEGVEGQGGSAVVYRASYEDRLNKGYFHQVLIKELYPLHENDGIWRDSRGNICWGEEAGERMDSCRRSFLAGNEVNLRLLCQMPEQISGNLNSYEAYNTFYSVLSVHGGTSLMALMEEEKAFPGLKEAAQAMVKILEAVKCFHQEGLLHLDISPDNILMLKSQALLIDYNSTWQTGRPWEEGFFFSEKEGYTAPEIRLRRLSAIGSATDLYSVCAVFFRMVTGRRLSDEDMTGKGPGRAISPQLGIFRDMPPSALWKTVQIIAKGLHMLPKRRYQSADELADEFRELIRRVEGRGISHSAVWEGSLRRLKALCRDKEHYLERQITLEGEDCYEALRQGKEILLTGAGGMGKTSFLLEMAAKNMKRYSPRDPAVCYVPLADYQETAGEPCYIRRSMLRGLCFLDQAEDMDTALHQLDLLFEESGGGEAGYILLLDGLNEAGEKRRGLLQEMEKLGSMPGIGILVTDRTDSVKTYGLGGFVPVSLLPLEREQVEGALAEDGVSPPEDLCLREMLRNPMVLSLYRRTAKLAEDQKGPGAGEKVPQNMEDMIGCYLDNLHTHQLRVDSGNLEEQLRHSYVLTHFLPSAAREMEKKKKVILTFQELYGLAEKSYRILLKKQFALAFPEYAGRSRVMLAGIANEGEWFDYAVREHLMGRLDLLVQAESGNYRLCHENFLGYLAEEDRRNRRIYRKAAGRLYGMRIGAGLLAALLLTGGGMAAARVWGPGTLTREEKAVMRNACQRLLINLQLLDIQLMEQENVLKEASESKVLDGDRAESEKLRQELQRVRNEKERYQITASDGAELLEELRGIAGQGKGEPFPLDTLEDLYMRPFEMADMMEDVLGYLDDCLCAPDSPYQNRSQREPLVKAYGEYVEAYGDAAYLELNQILSYMEEDDRAMVLDAVADMSVLKRYMLKYPLSAMTADEWERRREAAENQLEDAKGSLRRQNFSMKAPGWR